jgi:hypothetical protein
MTTLFKKGAFLAVSLSAALICGTAFAASSTVSFTASYKGQGQNSTSCNTTDQISGMEPSASGKYPVFIYTVGTTETFTNTVATAAVQDMANAGFVAATVNYATATFGNCSQIGGKAECIYNSSSSSSAISALCSRAKADCSKGIFTAGASQGAVIATLAKNFDSQVQAVYGIADGVMYTSAFNLTSCMANGNRTLPSNMLRAVNGLDDQFTGVGQSAQVTNMESLTGFNCGASADSCLQSNGSGWIIVQQNQLASNATDDHCYPRTGGCNSNQNSIQQGFLTGNGDWALPANLGFLQSIEQSLNGN